MKRPTDHDLLNHISSTYGITYGEACDWVLAIAENLRAAA